MPIQFRTTTNSLRRPTRRLPPSLRRQSLRQISTICPGYSARQGVWVTVPDGDLLEHSATLIDKIERRMIEYRILRASDATREFVRRMRGMQTEQEEPEQPEERQKPEQKPEEPEEPEDEPAQASEQEKEEEPAEQHDEPEQEAPEEDEEQPKAKKTARKRAPRRRTPARRTTKK